MLVSSGQHVRRRPVRGWSFEPLTASNSGNRACLASMQKVSRIIQVPGELSRRVRQGAELTKVLHYTMLPALHRRGFTHTAHA